MAKSSAETRADLFRIQRIVSMASAGQIRIPQFQRNYRWTRQDVLALFDSIYKGYPVGSLLFWQRPSHPEKIRLGLLDINAPEQAEAYFVVDGQQRITALTNALSEEVYEKSDQFRIAYSLTKKNFIEVPKDTGDDAIPLPHLFDLRKLLTWIQEHPEHGDEVENLNDVATKLRDFEFPVFVVTGNDETALREIFDRINNAGKVLKRAEIFHALFSASHGSASTIEAIADALEDSDFGRIDDNTILHAILARRSPDYNREIRPEFSGDRAHLFDVPKETQAEAYERGGQAIRKAIEFLQLSGKIPHISFLPYKILLIVLSRFFAHHPNPHPRNVELLCRWVWRIAASGGAFVGGLSIHGPRFARAIVPTDESASVQNMLSLLPEGTSSVPNLDIFRTNSPSSKVVMCALFDLGPQRFSDGKRLTRKDIATSLAGATTPAPIIERIPNSNSTKAGARFFLSEDDLSPDDAIAILAGSSDGLINDNSAIRRSHLVDCTASALLAEGKTEEFIIYRQSELQSALKNFLNRQTGQGLPDHPPINSMMMD